MKKLLALFFVLIGAIGFALTGCSDGDTFSEKSYRSGESEIEKITVQVSDRELEISESGDDRVYIDYFDSEKEYLDINVSESRELTVKLTGYISLNSNGGNIVCERVDVGKAISLTSKNGSISGSVIGGWDDFSISCTIKKGDCNLPELKEGGEKSFYANCNNGDIKIEFIK